LIPHFPVSILPVLSWVGEYTAASCVKRWDGGRLVV
jgi:hypothetical protein